MKYSLKELQDLESKLSKATEEVNIIITIHTDALRKRGVFVTQNMHEIYDKIYKPRGIGKSNEVLNKIKDTVKNKPEYKKLNNRLKAADKNLKEIDSKWEKAEQRENQIKSEIRKFGD
jgi:spermidine synthase